MIKSDSGKHLLRLLFIYKTATFKVLKMQRFENCHLLHSSCKLAICRSLENRYFSHVRILVPVNNSHAQIARRPQQQRWMPEFCLALLTMLSKVEIYCAITLIRGDTLLTRAIYWLHLYADEGQPLDKTGEKFQKRWRTRSVIKVTRGEKLLMPSGFRSNVQSLATCLAFILQCLQHTAIVWLAWIHSSTHSAVNHDNYRPPPFFKNIK